VSVVDVERAQGGVIAHEDEILVNCWRSEPEEPEWVGGVLPP
jgi:hypothetical protein